MSFGQLTSGARLENSNVTDLGNSAALWWDYMEDWEEDYTSFKIFIWRMIFFFLSLQIHPKSLLRMEKLYGTQLLLVLVIGKMDHCQILLSDPFRIQELHWLCRGSYPATIHQINHLLNWFNSCLSTSHLRGSWFDIQHSLKVLGFSSLLLPCRDQIVNSFFIRMDGFAENISFNCIQ